MVGRVVTSPVVTTVLSSIHVQRQTRPSCPQRTVHRVALDSVRVEDQISTAHGVQLTPPSYPIF
jgi:hypothetical protein